MIAFPSEQDDLWLSPVVLHELEFGWRLLPRGAVAKGLESVLSAFATEYEGRIPPRERREAEWAARLRSQAVRLGPVLALGRCPDCRDSQGSRPFGRKTECREFRRAGR